jgi:hypothetical protein
LADIVTAEQPPEGVTCDAALWPRASAERCSATIIARRSRRRLHDRALAREQRIPVVSARADNATQKYGVNSVSLLARRR